MLLLVLLGSVLRHGFLGVSVERVEHLEVPSCPLALQLSTGFLSLILNGFVGIFEYIAVNLVI